MTETTQPDPENQAIDAPATAAGGPDADPAAPAAGPATLAPAECAALLAQHFPALFGAGRALPIKLRIQADIQQRTPGIFSKKSLSIFLHRYTTSTAYLKALLQSPHRFDLDGAAAGEIAEEHRAAATAEVERRRAIVEERRAAEREAQRRQGGQPRRAVAPPRREPAGVAGVEAGVAPGAEAAPRPRAEQRGDRPAHAQPRHRHPPGQSTGQPASQQAAQRVDPRPEPAAETRAEPRVEGPVESAAEIDARRNRATLLRAWETTTLTRANFCALKGLVETDFESQLAQARTEREQRPPPPARGAGEHHGGNDGRGGPRREGGAGDGRGNRPPRGRPAR